MKNEEHLLHKQTKKYLQQKLVDLRKLLDKTLEEMGDAANHNQDLRENFAYMTKEQEVAYIKSRIIETKIIIANSQVIQKPKKSTFIQLGSKFDIVFLDTKEQMTYILGGEQDAINFPKAYLNYKSPVGQKILGKSKGYKDYTLIIINVYN